MRQDKDNTYKGQLHFVAEFVPAIFLKNVRFDAPKNEIQKAIEVQADSSDNDQSGTKARPDGMNGIPQVAAAQDDAIEAFQAGQTKDPQSTDMTHTVHTTVTTEASKPSRTDTAEELKYEGAEMSKEELLKYRR